MDTIDHPKFTDTVIPAPLTEGIIIRRNAETGTLETLTGFAPVQDGNSWKLSRIDELEIASLTEKGEKYEPHQPT